MQYSDTFSATGYPTLKHSGLGIASFAIAIFAGFLVFVLVAIAVVIAVMAQGELDENTPEAILVGLGIIGALLIDLLAVVLGIAGLFQAERKKLFAVLGIIIGSLVFLGVALLIVLGTMME